VALQASGFSVPGGLKIMTLAAPMHRVCRIVKEVLVLESISNTFELIHRREAERPKLDLAG